MQKTVHILGLATIMSGCASGNAGTQTASPPRAIETKTVQTTAKPVEPTAPQKAEASPSTPTPTPSKEAGPEKALVAALPKACTKQKDCVPPKAFAEAACHGRYPSMAIAMFEKHTPWQRLYLKAVSTEAVNAYGDRNVSSPLVFGEEVLVLRGQSQPKPGRVQVSSSDIDVLRWDGTCATVARELFSTTRMPNVVQAPIEWRYLEDTIQQALLSSKYVSIRYEQYRSACKSSRASDSESQCHKATERLNEAIGVAVRDGLTLPQPEKLPVWATPDQLQEQGSVAMATSTP